MTQPFTPEYEFEKTTFNPLNIVAFREFIIENKVFASALSFLIATQLKDVVNSFLTGIIDPLIMYDGDNDGKPDIMCIDKWTLKIKKIEFKIGHIFVECIKFIILLYFMFIMTRFFRDIVN